MIARGYFADAIIYLAFVKHNLFNATIYLAIASVFFRLAYLNF